MHKATDPHSHSDLRLTGLVLAVLAFCLIASVSDDYQRSGVVVSNAGEKVRILVEPIGFVSGGRLTKLPDETQPQRIRSRKRL